MPTKYESPDVKRILTPDDIRRRYSDTSLIIFKVSKIKLIN